MLQISGGAGMEATLGFFFFFRFFFFYLSEPRSRFASLLTEIANGNDASFPGFSGLCAAFASRIQGNEPSWNNMFAFLF